MKHNLLILVILCFVVQFFIGEFLIFSPDSLDDLVPDSGRYLSENGEILISFEYDNPYSIVTINGREIKCMLTNEKFTDWITVGCQELNNPEFALGETLFSGTVISWSETEMIVEEDKTGKQYVFTRIDEEIKEAESHG